MVRKLLAITLIFICSSILMIPLLTDAADNLVINAAPKNSSGSESMELDPTVEKFLETEWMNPITKKEATMILKESSENVWSVPEMDSIPRQEIDLNMTDDLEMIMLSGSQSFPVWSEWPWQDSTHIREDFSATPTGPNMDGHFFLKKSYSKLWYQTEIDNLNEGNVYIWIWLERWQDTYNRYLTVKFDENEVIRFVVGSQGYKGCIAVPSNKIDTTDSEHLVELQINYGGYVERGWRLRYCWVGIGNGPNGYQQTPVRDSSPPRHPEPFTEFVPRSGITNTVLEYNVYCGSDTILNIETTNENDHSTRVVDIYVDDVYKSSILSPGAYEVDLGDYTGSLGCILKMVFRNMPDIDYPKRITQFAVHRLQWTLEIDIMPAASQATIITYINAMNAWYKVHSYHRVAYYFSGVLADAYDTNVLGHMGFWTTSYEHKGWPYWEYVIWVNRLVSLDGSEYYGGWHVPTALIDYGIGVSLEHGGSTTIWHEYGHHIGILVTTGFPPKESYCNYPDCIMSGFTGSYYCWFHWHLRSFT